MEQSVSSPTVTIRCPACLNQMRAKALKEGAFQGKCPVCKAAIFSKQKNRFETHIRIVRPQAN